MAQKHIVKQGNADMWINSFMEWICKARQNYKVDFFVTFAVENPPCTSGLPSDIPIEGLPTPADVPDFVPTGPAGPIELPSPQPTGGAAPKQ
jgi:hypothetical protein